MRSDKLYTIDRVRCDLRSCIYELMQHQGYHGLEKEFTEQLIQSYPLYRALRQFDQDVSLSPEFKKQSKELFSFYLYLRMNEKLGAFDFNRFHSFSSGGAENQLFQELIETTSFQNFLSQKSHLEQLVYHSEYAQFVSSGQYRSLESSICASIKKNRVIPGLSRAIARDIVDVLTLQENYGYIRLSDEARQKRFFFENEKVPIYVSLKTTTIQFDNARYLVLLKRVSRNSDQFSYLLTDFGALIRGKRCDEHL